MSRRKKNQGDSYETAEGFQIEDMEGNAVTDDHADEEQFEDEDSFWKDDDDDEQEEDDFFNSVAENEDWEEGYDY